jgi:N6-L-threonylcarbamoyladenine synthase
VNSSSNLRIRQLLAIESSCDETAAAVVREDGTVLSSIIASQHELHIEWGGVVPEIASRAHVRRILPVIKAALRDANCTPQDLHAVAVTTEPGLVGSLLVGLTAAKTIAMNLTDPADHGESCRSAYLCMRHGAVRIHLSVCGICRQWWSHEFVRLSFCHRVKLIGSTIDDAAGEAFDKVARILDLPYPGGPSIQKAAAIGKSTSLQNAASDAAQWQAGF